MQQNRKTSLKLLRVFVTANHVGNQSLLIDYVLAYEHCVFLQLIDVQEEILVNVFLLINSLAVLRNLLTHQLDHVCIQIDTLIHDAGKDRVAVRIRLWHCDNPSLKFGEAPQGDISQSGKTVPHEGKGNSFHRVILRTWHQEVGVGKNRIFCLRKT